MKIKALLALPLVFFTSFKTASPDTVTAKTGIASYYNDKHEGKKTASGEIFRQEKFTAAHRTLPFGTMVKVTNLSNGRSVTVRVNDRGPFAKGRLIDLSKAAAREIDLIKMGITKVSIEYELVVQ